MVIQLHVLTVEKLEVCSDWCKCQKPESNHQSQGPCVLGARQLEQERISAAGGECVESNKGSNQRMVMVKGCVNVCAYGNPEQRGICVSFSV